MAAITMQANHSAKQDVIRHELMSGRKEETEKETDSKETDYKCGHTL
jgi:hypothetical protein